jgi:hypothetical protein
MEAESPSVRCLIMISELAALLTEFARSAVPDLMEILDVDCDVPTEAAELEQAISAEPSDESSLAESFG